MYYSLNTQIFVIKKVIAADSGISPLSEMFFFENNVELIPLVDAIPTVNSVPHVR